MIYELYTTKHWMIMPSFVHGILPTLMYNANNRIAIGVVEKKRPYLAVAGGSDVIRDAQVTEDGTVTPRRDEWGQNLLAQMREPFVNVVPIDGPITRNGDACSYGSKDIRDWMMEAASNKFCRAHVFIGNSPGGSAWAKNDFQQAIDFAHSKGQRVYMLIDGLCASALMYCASFCDEVYVVNLKDQLGCVGVMASFFTLKNGDKNQLNSETYHEYYATKSINKNKEYRDIAEDDDATLLIQELDELEDEFRADMKKSFPNATDEHLDGKIFDADKVMGILCDGQMMLGDVVARAFAVANGSEEPIERTASRNVGQPEDVPDENPDEDTTAAALANAEAATGRIAAMMDNVSPKNSTTMTKEKYQKIAQLLEVDELIVTEEGTFLNTPLLDKLSEKLEEMQAKTNAPAAQANQEPAAEPAQEPAAEPAQEPASEPAQEPAAEPSGESSQEPAAEPAAEPSADPAAEPAAEPSAEPAAEPASEEAIEDTTAEIDKMQETLHNAEQMVADRDQQIAQLKESLATLTGIAEERDQANATVAERDKTIETLTADKEAQGKQLQDAEAKIAQHVATIETLKKQLAEKEAEIKELSGQPAPMTDGTAGVPQDNGTGEAPQYNGIKSAVRPGMSPAEIRAALRKQDEEIKARRSKR